MIAILIAGAMIGQCINHCSIPRAAYAAESRDPTRREMRVIWHWAADVCGPDGTVDLDPVPDSRGRDHIEPHCNHDGWNGQRYIEGKTQ